MNDLLQLLPVLFVACTGLAVLAIDLFRGPDAGGGRHLAWLTVLGMAAATISSLVLWPGAKESFAAMPFAGAVRVDAFALFAWLVLIAVTALSALSSLGFDEENNLDHGEYYALLSFSLVGMMLMVSAVDLLTLFLGLETMSLSIYSLIAMKRSSSIAAEASFKYFINGAVASALMLYGIAVLWGETGTLKLPELGRALADNAGNPLLFAAASLVLVAFGFKVAAVPFHMWTPDAYEGAAAPVTGFMASAVKTAAFAALLRFVFSSSVADIFTAVPFSFVDAVIALSVLTMTVGNLMAMHQTSVKRMLAYSSISHAGYLLMALTLVPSLGSGQSSLRFVNGSALFYLAAYGLSTLLAFGVLARLGGGGSEDATYTRLEGLGRRRPGLAFLLSLALISLAGFPPTVGFFAKFFLFREMLVLSKGRLVLLVVIAVVNALFSVYYYLKPIVAMYMKEAGEERKELSNASSDFALVAAAVAVLALGLFPAPLSDAAMKAGKAVVYENAAGLQDGSTGALAPFSQAADEKESSRDKSDSAGAVKK